MSTRNNTGVTLRSASSVEAGILTSIHRECFPHYWDCDAFTDFFRVKGTSALIASTPDPVGMLVYRVQHEQADIITVAVRPAWRRFGIARALLQEAIKTSQFQGATEMFLDVEDGNSAAIKLYESFGFTHLKRRKLYYRQKDGSYTDALVMRGKLR